MWIWAKELRIPEVADAATFSSGSPESVKRTASMYSENEGIDRTSESKTAAVRRIEIRGAQRRLTVTESSQDFMLKLHKLRVRQQEIREMEAVVEERLLAFRVHLQELLNGRE